MRKKSFFTKIVSLTLVAALFCTMSAAAFSEESSYRPISSGSYTFDIYAILNSDRNGKLSAGTWAQEQTAQKAPVGYISVLAQLVNRSGRALRQSQWVSNDVRTHFAYAYTDSFWMTEEVCSRGLVSTPDLTKDQDTYRTNYYDSNSVPTFAADLMCELNENGEYPTNTAGETYGSTLLASVVGHQPDLIAAVGVHGIEGYIRDDEVNPNLFTKADYDAYLADLDKKGWQVSLYDLDGSVVDFFKIDKCEDVAPGETDPEIVKSALLARMNGDSLPVDDAKKAATPAEIRAYFEGPIAERSQSRASIADNERTTQEHIDMWLENGQYRTTASGKTYGPVTLREVVGELPELIAVVGVNGNEGFAEAELVDRVCRGLEPLETSIPVFDLDEQKIDEYFVCAARTLTTA